MLITFLLLYLMLMVPLVKTSFLFCTFAVLWKKQASEITGSVGVIQMLVIFFHIVFLGFLLTELFEAVPITQDHSMKDDVTSKSKLLRRILWVWRYSVLHSVSCIPNYYIELIIEIMLLKIIVQSLPASGLWRHLMSEFAWRFLSVVGLPLTSYFLVILESHAQWI